MSPWKKLAFSIVAIVAGLLLLEGLCGVGWLVADYPAFRASRPRAVEFKEEHHARYDPEIGWVNVPGKRLTDFYGPGTTITINAEGFRATEDYADKPADRYRLICLGDSFTHGYGVGDDDTWPARLQALLPGVQAVNMGQGGYSLGQIWLWFERDAPRLRPDGVVLALIADDFWRMAGDRMINGYGKPTFRLDGGRVVVGNQPVPPKIDTGRPLDGWAATVSFLAEESRLVRTVSRLVAARGNESPDDTRQEQLAIGLAMIEEIHETLHAAGTPFALVLLPELRELADPDLRVEHERFAAGLRAFAEGRGIPFLSLYPAFLDLGPRRAEPMFLQEQWSHFSPAGNAFVAERVGAFLGERFPGFPRRPIAP